MHSQLGKYTLEELVAVGGMAEIYRAHTSGIGGVEKVLAIKKLHEHYCSDREFVDMLVNEARIAVRLNHKNIAQVFDLEQDGEAYFIAMEYVNGRDLSRVVARFVEQSAMMPLEAAVYVAMQICSGLSYAHRVTDPGGSPLNIIHRDISPQNVLLSFEGEVKLVDFGIAKAARRSTFTQTGTIKGKFYYMSPEQARGDRIDQRADIFSVGAILYEMVTGRMLYEGEDDARLVQRVRRADYRLPSAVCPDVPEQLERIILKALARDLNQRFQTARDLQLALSEFLRVQGVVFDSVLLSEMMHRIFRTGQDSSSAVYDAVPELGGNYMGRKDYSQGSNSLVGKAVGWDVDENADTNVYGREKVDDIIEELEEFYGHAPGGGGLRRAMTPGAPRQVDIDIDRSRYREPTRINSMPDRPEGERPPMGLFLAAIAGVLLLSWAFLFMTNQHVSVKHEPTEGPRVQREGSGLEDGFEVYSDPPRARILVDGVDTGQVTPATLVKVNPGEHEVTIHAEYYDSYQQRVEVKDGGRMDVVLIPKLGVIKIETDPPGAAILVDGLPKGTAPVNVSDQRMGEAHRIAASHKGYKDLVKMVRWQTEEPVLEISLRLSPDDLKYGDVLRAFEKGAGNSIVGLIRGGVPEVEEVETPEVVEEVEEVEDEDDKKRSKRRKKKRRSSGAVGILSVNSKPPGKLYIDGRSSGRTTPVRGMSLESGYHKVKVRYSDGSYSNEKKALIKPGQEVKLFFRE